MDIKEGNILIAKFMGWELSKKGKKFKNYLPPYGYVKAHPDYLKFHESWDWLMPVVEMIEQTYIEDVQILVEMVNGTCNLSTCRNSILDPYYLDIYKHKDSYIKNVYDVCVEFIEKSATFPLDKR